MNEKTIQCLPNPSQHVPINLQQFPSYSNRKCKKNRRLRIAAHIFVITQYVAWMKRQFNAYQTSRSMYPSMFNSFRVIRWLSQCVRQKSQFLPPFCFPWGPPWGNHAKCCMDGKKIYSLLTNCLAACAHITITVSQIERGIGRKSSFFHTPLHSTPPLGGFPSY